MNIDDILSTNTAKVAVRRWRQFLGVMVAVLFIGAVTYTQLPRKYLITAEVIGTRYESDITPNNQSPGFSAAALLGGNSNDLPNINDFKLYTQLLTSTELGAAILNDPVMHAVLKRMWRKDHWQQPDTWLSRLSAFMNELAGQKAWVPPDGFTIARYLASNITIVPNKDAKLVTISTWNEDPELGKALLTLVSSRADDMVKEMAQKRFQAKVSFLEKALASTNVEETRTALGQALAKAETDKVYSESTLPFAAEFLAPPASPLQPQFPKFFITMIIFVALGIVVYLLDVYFVVRTSKSVWETIFANLRRSSDDGVRARSDSSRRTVL
jgi:uncharacterized protein involved in exopolysaccharide biosynthesis